MPTYTVRCRVDAYIDYLAEVEADSPEEAAELANVRPALRGGREIWGRYIDFRYFRLARPHTPTSNRSARTAAISGPASCAGSSHVPHSSGSRMTGARVW